MKKITFLFAGLLYIVPSSLAYAAGVCGYVDVKTDVPGPGLPTLPTDPPASGKLPDFITDKVILANQSGSKEKYRWQINETAYVHSWTDNIGDADWEGSADKIKVPFYLSKGTKEDRHSEWKRIAREQIQKNKLKRNKPPKHEYIKFNLQDWARAHQFLHRHIQ
ncbi:MAG: hypothetical protein D3906_16550, partial [Candidatus Electrothrix sp. AUS1_2]|nr:hypothetical protein [Candidatus Electrothrix sp. AUS1_2]